MPFLSSLATLQDYLHTAKQAFTTYYPLKPEIESSLVQINEEWILLVNRTARAESTTWRSALDGGCLEVTPRLAEWLGMPPSEAYGYGWGKAVHPDDRQRVIAEYRTACTTGSVFESFYRYQHDDGSIAHIYGFALPVRNDAGEIVEYWGRAVRLTEEEWAACREK